MPSPVTKPLYRKIEQVRINNKVVDLIIRIERAGISYKLGKERWTHAYDMPWEMAYLAAVKFHVLHNPPTKRRTKLVKRGLLSVGLG